MIIIKCECDINGCNEHFTFKLTTEQSIETEYFSRIRQLLNASKWIQTSGINKDVSVRLICDVCASKYLDIGEENAS